MFFKLLVSGMFKNDWLKSNIDEYPSDIPLFHSSNSFDINTAPFAIVDNTFGGGSQFYIASTKKFNGKSKMIICHLLGLDPVRYPQN